MQVTVLHGEGPVFFAILSSIMKQSKTQKIIVKNILVLNAAGNCLNINLYYIWIFTDFFKRISYKLMLCKDKG